MPGIGLGGRVGRERGGVRGERASEGTVVRGAGRVRMGRIEEE